MCSDAHGLSAAMPLRADACPLTGREIRKTTAMEIAGCVFTGHFLPHWRAVIRGHVRACAANSGAAPRSTFVQPPAVLTHVAYHFLNFT